MSSLLVRVLNSPYAAYCVDCKTYLGKKKIFLHKCHKEGDDE